MTKTEPRVNDAIKVKRVLVISDTGEKLGDLALKDALAIAEEKGLDLVEVAPNVDPPVCKLLNFGKYRYQQQKKDKEARKKQKITTMKEMKMRPKIEEHDYNFKLKKIRSFLEEGHRVKISVFFRGREMSYTEMGKELLLKVAQDCEDLAKLEMTPKLEGRFMRIVLNSKNQ